jgi:hypothetical protein
MLIPIDGLVGETEARTHEQRQGTLISNYVQSLDADRRMLVNCFG